MKLLGLMFSRQVFSRYEFSRHVFSRNLFSGRLFSGRLVNIAFMLVVAVIFTVPNVSAADTVTAQQIMSQVFDRDVGEDSVSSLSMEYVKKSGKTKSMLFDVWNKSYPGGSKSLMKYKKPNFMRDTGLLMHSQKQGGDLQWLYLSRSSKRVPRKIGEGEKGDRLFGTDVYYIDMEEKSVEHYSFSLKGEATVNNRPCYIIESVANDPDYPYSKTVSWVDKERFIELKVDFYQKEQVIKTLDVETVALLEGIWTVKASKMSNSESGSYTRMDIAKIDYNVGLDERRFSFSALTASNKR